MVNGALCSCSDTALLLCCKNFSLELRKTVGLWLASCVSLFFLGFESRRLLCGQPLSGQKSCGTGGVFVQASLGIGRVFGVVLVLQPLHLFGFALTAGKGESGQSKRERAIVRIEISLKRLWNGVVGIRRQKQVLREIHFHAMALPNRDGGRYLQEAVKNAGR